MTVRLYVLKARDSPRHHQATRGWLIGQRKRLSSFKTLRCKKTGPNTFSSPSQQSGVTIQKRSLDSLFFTA
ncbi:hypothetical protein ACOSQ3_011040 [Xanthoceras sorbifolium]